jgi:hypothetical protein
MCMATITLGITKNTVPSRQNGSVNVDAIRQSRQRHRGGGLLRSQNWCHTSCRILPCNRRIMLSFCSVSHQLWMNAWVLWQTVTPCPNGLTEYELASWIQSNGWGCKNHFSRSVYQHAQCNSLFPNHSQYSKLPDLGAYWHSFTRLVYLLYCYR